MRLLVTFGLEKVLFPKNTNLTALAEALDGAVMVDENGGYGGKPESLRVDEKAKISLTLLPNARAEAMLRAGEDIKTMGEEVT